MNLESFTIFSELDSQTGYLSLKESGSLCIYV